MNRSREQTPQPGWLYPSGQPGNDDDRSSSPHSNQSDSSENPFHPRASASIPTSPRGAVDWDEDDRWSFDGSRNGLSPSPGRDRMLPVVPIPRSHDGDFVGRSHDHLHLESLRSLSPKDDEGDSLLDDYVDNVEYHNYPRFPSQGVRSSMTSIPTQRRSSSESSTSVSDLDVDEDDEFLQRYDDSNIFSDIVDDYDDYGSHDSGHIPKGDSAKGGGRDGPRLDSFSETATAIAALRFSESSSQSRVSHASEITTAPGESEEFVEFNQSHKPPASRHNADTSPKAAHLTGSDSSSSSPNSRKAISPLTSPIPARGSSYAITAHVAKTAPITGKMPDKKDITAALTAAKALARDRRTNATFGGHDSSLADAKMAQIQTSFIQGSSLSNHSSPDRDPTSPPVYLRQMRAVPGSVSNDIDSLLTMSASHSNPLIPLRPSASLGSIKSQGSISTGGTTAFSLSGDSATHLAQVDRLLDLGAQYLQSPQSSNHLDQAFQVWQEAQEMAAVLGDHTREARAWNNMACVCRLRGNDIAALDCVDSCIDLTRKTVELAFEAKRARGETLPVPPDLVPSFVDSSTEPRERERLRKLKDVKVMLSGIGWARFEDEISLEPQIMSLNSGAIVGEVDRRGSVKMGRTDTLTRSKTEKGRREWKSGKKLGWFLGAEDEAGTSLRAPVKGSGNSTATPRAASSGTIQSPGSKSSKRKPISVELPPPVIVLLMDLSTTIGNIHFTFGRISDSFTWHQICLDIAHDTLLTWPLPPSKSGGEGDFGAQPGTRSSFQHLRLSYLHQRTLHARCRSFSHLGLCLQRLGEAHRAVRFQQRAQAALHNGSFLTSAIQADSTTVYQSIVAQVTGNLAVAQFEVGRIVEASRGLAEAARRFGENRDRLGMLRAQANAAACWLEIGRLSETVAIVVGEPKASTKPAILAKPVVHPAVEAQNPKFQQLAERAASAVPGPLKTKSGIVVPQRRGSLRDSGNASSSVGAPSLEVLRRAMSVSTSAAGAGPGGPSNSGLSGSRYRKGPPTLNDPGFTAAKPSAIAIPPRSHSVPFSRDGAAAPAASSNPRSPQKTIGTDELAELAHKARKTGPTWFADIVNSLKILYVMANEAEVCQDAVCAGLIRFNIAAALIMLKLPAEAARVLCDSSFDWNAILSNKHALHEAGKSSPDYTQSSSVTYAIERSAALFNFSQLVFCVLVEPIAPARPEIASTPQHSDTSPLSRIAELILKHTETNSSRSIFEVLEESPSGAIPTTPITSLDEFSIPSFPPSQSFAQRPDPSQLVRALKRCLEWADGSPSGPLASARAISSSPASRYTSDGQIGARPSGYGGVGVATNRRPSQPNLAHASVVPPTPPTDFRNPLALHRLPLGSAEQTPRGRSCTTGASTRICLALARALVAIFGSDTKVDLQQRRRIELARDEGSRWCNAEALLAVEAVAAASARSASRTDEGVVGGAGVAGLNELEASLQDTRDPMRGALQVGAAASASATSTATTSNADGVSNGGGFDSARQRRRSSGSGGARRSRKSLVVSGSEMEGLLISVLAEAGEGHGVLALQMGALSWELERLASRGWRSEDDVFSDAAAAAAIEEGGSGGADKLKLVKLAARRIKEEVLRTVRLEEVELESELQKIRASM
ncbi:hypothetical protein DFJ73DRAFT_848013 [Zopfochytrium polystomum]|nr:hypothetical protein DFJ73DRAFT_848013 [Zopfochytrium polystomum]